MLCVCRYSRSRHAEFRAVVTADGVTDDLPGCHQMHVHAVVAAYQRHFESCLQPLLRQVFKGQDRIVLSYDFDEIDPHRYLDSSSISNSEH